MRFLNGEDLVTYLKSIGYVLVEENMLVLNLPNIKEQKADIRRLATRIHTDVGALLKDRVGSTALKVNGSYSFRPGAQELVNKLTMLSKDYSFDSELLYKVIMEYVNKVIDGTVTYPQTLGNYIYKNKASNLWNDYENYEDSNNSFINNDVI
jgi:hypothetical protein